MQTMVRPISRGRIGISGIIASTNKGLDMKRELLIAFSAASLMSGVAFAAPPSSMSKDTQTPAATQTDTTKAGDMKSDTAQRPAMPTSHSASDSTAIGQSASKGGLTMAKSAKMAVRFTSQSQPN